MAASRSDRFGLFKHRPPRVHGGRRERAPRHRGALSTVVMSAILSIAVVVITPIGSSALGRLLSLVAQSAHLVPPSSGEILVGQLLILVAPIVGLGAVLSRRPLLLSLGIGALLVAASALVIDGSALVTQIAVVIGSLGAGLLLPGALGALSSGARTRLRIAAARTTAGLLALLMVWTGATLTVLAMSADDPLSGRIDAVMVLGPSDARNVAEGVLLARRSSGAVLVLSSSRDGDGRFKNKECTAEMDIEVVCLRADPFTTEGELSALDELSVTSQWSRIAIITSVPHVPRARWMAERCLSPGHAVLGRSAPNSISLWMTAGAYQSAAWIKSLVHPPCS